MSIFTYILKRLAPKKRPKWLGIVAQTFKQSWKKPQRYVKAQKRPLWRFFQRRIAANHYPLPIVQPSNLTWKWPWFRLVRKSQRRPLWRYFQRRIWANHYPLPVVRPSNLTWKWPWFRIVKKAQKRPLWRYFNKRIAGNRYPLPIVGPSNLTWKWPWFRLVRKIQKRPLWRFFQRGIKIRLYPLPVITPSNLSWKRPPNKLKPQRRPLWRFQRLVTHKYPFQVPAVIFKRPPKIRIKRLLRLIRRQKTYPLPVVQPSSLSWKRPPNRLRPQRRPLWRFQRVVIHKYPFSSLVLVFKRSPRIRIKRLWRLLRSIRQKTYPLPVVQPSSLSWKRPPNKLRPQRRPLWRFQRLVTHRYPFPSPSPPVIFKRPPKFRIKRPWRLLRSIRQKTYPLPIVQPSNLAWKAPRRKIARHRPCLLRPKRYPIIAAAPIVWQRQRRLRLHSRPIPRFFRPRHIGLPPAQPANILLQRNWRIYLKRRKAFYFPWRSVHHVIDIEATTPPSGPTYRGMRHRIHRLLNQGTQ